MSLIPRLNPPSVSDLKLWLVFLRRRTLEIKLVLLHYFVPVRLNSWVYKHVQFWIAIFLNERRMGLSDLRSSHRILVGRWVKILASGGRNWFDCFESLLLRQNGRSNTPRSLEFPLNLYFGTIFESCDRRSYIWVNRHFILIEMLLLLHSRWLLKLGLHYWSTLQLPALFK
jgi:hypothetical protein